MNADPDFADEILGLGVATLDPEPERPAPARPKASAQEISVLQRVLADADELARNGKVAPRNRDCARCSATAASEEKAGRAKPIVLQVERYVVEGAVYFTGLCRTCNDIEWSANWSRKFEAVKAKGDRSEMERLTLQVMAREQRGRRYLGKPWEGRLQ